MSGNEQLGRAAESKRRALEIDLPKRICYMFQFQNVEEAEI